MAYQLTYTGLETQALLDFVNTNQYGTRIIDVNESKTVLATDVYSFQNCSSTSEIIITVPLDSVTIPLNSEFVYFRDGTGAVSFSATSGVTLKSSDSKVTISKQYEAVTLKKITENNWILIGALA